MSSPASLKWAWSRFVRRDLYLFSHPGAKSVGALARKMPFLSTLAQPACKTRETALVQVARPESSKGVDVIAGPSFTGKDAAIPDLTYVWLALSALSAGAVNAIAGGGTLLTFATLLSVV